MELGLSIIIVNYYSEEYIVPLVTSILQSIKLNDYEIIIVSNSRSTFKWDDAFLKANSVRVFENTNNVGFGVAVNRGVSCSKYDILCLLNPDVRLNNNTLDGLYRYFQTMKHEVSAVSCLIKNSNDTRQNSFFMNKHLFKKDFALHYFKKLFPGFIRQRYFKEEMYTESECYDFTKPFEVAGFYASFCMIKKSVFIDVGGFDPDFFMYAEDVDLFRTRFSRKYRCMLYPLVELTHLSGKTDKYGLMRQQAQVSYLLYLRKAGNYYLAVHVTLLCLKNLMLLVRSLVKPTDRKEAIDFYISLKYLPRILRYPRGYETLPVSLKIDKIPD